MLVGSVSARDLSVRDVASEQVQEGVLRLVGDRRPPRALHEAFAFERMQELVDVVARAAFDNAAAPEDLSEYRRVLQQLFLGCGQPIETGRDDPLDVL